MVASLADLKALKYAELRTLCKENNLKAAGKTDALIASLANHFGFVDNEEALAPAPAPPAKAPAKKTASAKGKARKGVEVHEEEKELVEATPVKVQEKIVYQTSPNTKANVASLLSTVKILQSQLTAANSAISTLESRAAPPPAPRSPALKKADVVALIESKVAESRKALSKEFEDRFKAVSSRLAQLDEDVENAEMTQQKSLDELRSTFSTKLESAVAGVRDDLVARFAVQSEEKAEERPVAFEAASVAFEVATTAVAAAEVATAAATAVAPPLRRRVSFADSPEIADLDVDAPPTRSVSFSSPRSPALHTPLGTPRRSSLASRKATPFKLSESAQSGSSAPASALPSHMLATAASAAKRSPRAGRVSAPAQVQQTQPEVEPMSPAGPPPKAALGKRPRHSDASELSIDVSTLDSPAAEARSRSTPASSAPTSVVSPGRRLSEILASVSTSAKKEDQHVRKRQRVSTGSIIDHGPETEENEDEDEDDEDFHDSFDGSDESTSFDESVATDDGDELDEEVSVREYLVAIKTGDEEPTALKPAPRSPASTKSAVNDASFFAGLPSPAAAPSSRRSTLAVPVSPARAAVKENAAPASGRKSLPAAALPCPIVSPYSKKAPSSIGATSASTTPGKKPAAAAAAPPTFGTPTSIFNRRVTIGPAASARKATPSARPSPYSAKKPTPARSASASGASGTPQASRTLFGSERGLPSSSARSAATSQAQTAYGGDSSEELDGESRFGDDGFVSAGTSPARSRLSLSGWSMFGGRE